MFAKLNNQIRRKANIGRCLDFSSSRYHSLSFKGVEPSVFACPSATRVNCCRTIPSKVRLLHSSRRLLEHVHFKLADIGEGIHEVELTQWFVEEGDKIKQFDKICEVQSDKATVEITSRYDGVVSVVHHELGHNVQVGATLIEIEVDQESDSKPCLATADTTPHLEIPEAEKPAPELSKRWEPQAPSTTWKPRSLDAPTHPMNSSASSPSGKVLATPAVRRIARERGISLSSIHGSGKHGRILKEDLMGTMAPPAQVGLHQHAEFHAQPAVPHHHTFDYEPTPGMSQPLTPFMKAMTKLMDQSLKIPHMLYGDQIEMDNLIKLRSDMIPQAEELGLKLTYMPFILKATSLALKKYPILNSSISEDETEIIYHADHNIGIAMDTPHGLIVPVIKNCQQKSILDMAQDLKELRSLGQEGKLGPNHIHGATFSISNIGIIGGTFAGPIISPPQVAIGALGKTVKVPKFDESDNIVPCQVAAISWSADHRVIDGATLARFSNLWKEYLENPSKMIFELK